FIDGNAIAGTSASLTAGTYEVMAVNADGCETAAQTVEITENVEIELINASSQTIVCGLGDIILAPTGAGDGATYNYYLDADGTIPATPASGDVWVNSEIVGPRIIYVIATTANGCESAPLAASTYHYDELSVGDVSTTCNESDASYTVTFTIAGGNGVYTVNGASAPESWTSGPIAQGEGYSFTIDDSPLIPSCEPLTVAGDAPTCETAPIAAVDDFGATTPGEDVIINILTNDTGCSLDIGGILVSPSCGQIMDINAETGVVVYVADADTQCTVDTFVYEVIDCNGETTTATVTIFIEQVGGDLIVQVERDCTNAEETGVYTLNVAVQGGTAPFTVTGSINEVLETVGVTFTIITDGNPYEVSVVDATGAEFFEAGGEIACTKLAVDFIDFSGAVEAEGNALTWSTATEENNDFFVVEYSTDGNVFTSIGKVDGAGTTNDAAIYNFLHRDAPNGVSYYRIKAVAFDGEATYTGVISLVRGERVFDIVSVYPIPVSSVVNVNFTTKVKGSSTIQIHNVAGKLMNTQDVDTEDGINKVSLNVSSYPVGTYFLTVKNGEEVATTKFVKE
ncbi:MAG: T9SS type A sorting domain-containing protein, partial [Chitinophagales bacterium]